MPAMDQSGHAEVSPTRKLLGNGLAGTVPVALFIAVLLVAGCAPTATRMPSHVPAPMATDTSHLGQTSLPPGLTPGVLDTRPVPAGWTRVLDGQTFFNGIATSPADPHTLAGCPLPAQLTAVAGAAPPVLVLSTDGGVTWQSHPIPGADATTSCAVAADTEHAGTYVVTTNDAVFETTNAGQTWQTLSPPSGYTFGGSGSLVGGYLTEPLIPRAGTTGDRLAQLSPDGTWAILPPFAAGDFPISSNVDPDDPARIYAAVWLSQVRMALIVTTDRGSTWQTVRIWNAATLLDISTATNGRILVQATVNAKVPQEVWFSPDAGASWREVAANGDIGQAFIQPGGDVLTLYTAKAYGSLSGGSLSEVNLASGKLQRIASSPAFYDAIFCTTTTGALLCGDVWGTYRLPQPPAS